MSSRLERTLTGIPGLDELLNGGIPRGRVVLNVGGPGTGKTIMCAQFIFNGVKNYDENGVFVSLDESKAHFFSEMSRFGWNFEELEKERKFAFVDASPFGPSDYPLGPLGPVPRGKIGKITVGKREFSMDSLIKEIQSSAKRVDAKRIAVDPIAALLFQYPDMVRRRTAVLDLIEGLAATEATCILTAELRAVGLERGVQLEEYLAHGVIVLQTLRVGRTFVRVLQVEKMRETPIDMQPRPYRITEKGIEVYPKETVF